jgi:cobalt-precorrin-5B (C1)-methyltransferase
LGIVGGISILGTTGIVLPYSTASFAASIRQGIDVLLATHCDTAVLTTGSRSEDFAKAMLSLLPEQSFIQMGDFAGFSVLQCAKKKVPKVVIAGFIGKLSKIAMGVRQTHVAGSHVNLAFMAKLASECGASQELVEQIASANTARHVSEIVTRNRLNKYFDLICKKAHDELTSYSGSALQMSVVMFDFDGSVVGQYPIATE